MSTIKFTYVAKQGEGLRDIVEKQITELLKDHITSHKKQKLRAIKKFTREVLAKSKFNLSVNVLTKYQRIFPVRCTRHKTLEALISDSYCNSWKNITIRKGYDSKGNI